MWNSTVLVLHDGDATAANPGITKISAREDACRWRRPGATAGVVMTRNPRRVYDDRMVLERRILRSVDATLVQSGQVDLARSASQGGAAYIILYGTEYIRHR